MVEVVPLVDSGLGKGVTAIAAELAIWALTVWALGVGEGGIGQGVGPLPTTPTVTRREGVSPTARHLGATGHKRGTRG